LFIVAEINLSLAEYANFLAEEIIRSYQQRGEVSHDVKLEDNLHRLGALGLFRLPCHPLVALFTVILNVQSEVGASLIEVRELTESSEEVAVGDASVVGEVEEIHFGTPSVSLSHAVCNCAILTFKTSLFE